MAKSLMEIVNHEGIIVSDAMYGAFRKSVEQSHAVGGDGVITAVSITPTDPSVHAFPQVYMRLDELGKQQYCVRFKSGAIQVLATEP